MLEEDLFVLYMRLSMVINVELLAVLECENQTLRLVALMLLSGRRMSIRSIMNIIRTIFTCLFLLRFVRHP